MKELTNQFVQYNLLLTDHQDRRARIQDIVETQLTEMVHVLFLRGHSHIESSHSFFQIYASGWVGLAL